MNIDKQIEFDKIKEMWKGLAVTDKAKEIIEETGCYLAESELRKQMRDTTNSRILIFRSGSGCWWCPSSAFSVPPSQ